jgi:DNA invertase Pin-like site-specific DNA recombinase
MGPHGKLDFRPLTMLCLTGERRRVSQPTEIVGKLDRLARNVAFVSNLMEAGVDFVAVDFPQANRLTVHILAAVAEHEAKMISERTKAALAAAKARGVKLGGDHGARLTQKARRAGWEARMARADAKASDYAPVIAELQAAGTTSLRGIAAELNNRGIPTATGSGTWQAAQVSRLLARIAPKAKRELGGPGAARCPKVSALAAAPSMG